MTDSLRALNKEGVQAFAQFLQSARDGLQFQPPFGLLSDSTYSVPFSEDVQLEQKKFADGYLLGEYLNHALAPLNSRVISYDHGLWSWLALYFFDQICPEVNGTRKILREACYILGDSFDYRRYYRHLVRTPWLAFEKHKNFAKVLLQSKAGGKHTELAEQLISKQIIFDNPTIIEGAYKLYYDEVMQAPKRGAGGKRAGSPRRLAAFIGQINLTYDVRPCSADQFVQLLPKEFDRFRTVAPVAAPVKKGVLKKIFSSVIFPSSEEGTKAAST